jgi:hemolysin III
MSATTAAPQPARVKPRLRGVSHLHAFSAALAAGGVLVSAAPEARSAIASAIYAISLAGLFGISALYHTPMWSPRARRFLKRIDHAAIFLLIAGTMTPMYLLALPPDRGPMFVTIAWSGAAVGILRAVFWPGAPRVLIVGPYLALGWLPIFVLPQLLAGLGAVGFGLMIGGGLLYTLGAIAYGFRRPDPWPTVFGFHEVFHAFVIVAALLHFIAVQRLVLGA